MRTALTTLRLALLVSLGNLPLAACSGHPAEPGPKPTVAPCENPTAEGETGFVSCAGGWSHRPTLGVCPSSLPSDAEVVPPAMAVNVECTSDSDCTLAPHGHCRVVGNAPFAGPIDGDPEVVCRYGCVADGDCAAGSVCVCMGDWIGECVAASCTVDADCPESRCAIMQTRGSGCGLGQWVVACQKLDDECQGPGDCGNGQNVCQMVDGRRQCARVGACGRPFLVDGAPRVAAHRVASSAHERGTRGWASSVAPSVAELGAEARRRLGEHWTSIALMEHASVAAFARFTLELMSLGAEAALVGDAQRAMGDELAHARACFALAGAYCGRTVEPGALDLGGAFENLSPRAIATRAFLEACLGESIATAEALAQLECATEPAVRETLTKIAADEARHAALGWRFSKWFLSTRAAVERSSLEREFRALLAAASEAAADTSSEAVRDDASLERELAAHGMLTDSARREARRAAIAEVCRPCVEALFQADATHEVEAVATPARAAARAG